MRGKIFKNDNVLTVRQKARVLPHRNVIVVLYKTISSISSVCSETNDAFNNRISCCLRVHQVCHCCNSSKFAFHWSSGYGWWLMFVRSWARIPAPYTGWSFFTLICFINCNNVCLKRPKINEKEAVVSPFFEKKLVEIVNFLCQFFTLGHGAL